MEAGSLAESKLCLGEGSEGASLTSRATLELSGYTDDLAINVGSPRVSGQVGNASAGWSANGSYLIDVLSAASPDIVSMASRQYTETRHAGNVGGAYKPKDLGVSASANVSREPDYLSMGAGGAVTLDLENKQITPRLGYQFSHDTISKKDTPLALFERNLDTHTIDGNVSLVLTPRQALVLGTTLAFERGDQSKPYRYVPMFGAAQARDLRPGASISDVNNDRLSIRPREQLPLARTRVAIGARFVQRYPSGTLRIEERVYVDSWGVKGTTSDGRFLWDVAERLRIGPHVRLHMQTGASFHQLAYVATYDAQGSYTIPQYRTGDRELAPLVTVTAGASVRVGLTPARGPVRLALLLQACELALCARLFLRQCADEHAGGCHKLVQSLALAGKLLQAALGGAGLLHLVLVQPAQALDRLLVLRKLTLDARERLLQARLILRQARKLSTHPREVELQPLDIARRALRSPLLLHKLCAGLGDAGRQRCALGIRRLQQRALLACKLRRGRERASEFFHFALPAQKTRCEFALACWSRHNPARAIDYLARRRDEPQRVRVRNPRERPRDKQLRRREVLHQQRAAQQAVEQVIKRVIKRVIQRFTPRRFSPARIPLWLHQPAHWHDARRVRFAREQPMLCKHRKQLRVRCSCRRMFIAQRQEHHATGQAR
jgi:hypothetical protein